MNLATITAKQRGTDGELVRFLQFVSVTENWLTRTATIVEF